MRPLPGQLRRAARALGLGRARQALRRRRLVGRMMRASFADVPVDLDRMPAYRVEHFPEGGPLPWLDRPDAMEAVAARRARGEIDEQEAGVCERWIRDGYVVLESAIDRQVLDRTWDAYERAIAAGRIRLDPEKRRDDDPYPGRYLNPHNVVPELREILKHPVLLKWVSLLLGRPAAPYQTIASHKGSEQGVHADQIHMTTYPLGYLAASFTAMHDLEPGCGPLVLYPGSHRLPFLASRDAGIAVEDFRGRGYKVFEERYEAAVRRLIDARSLVPHAFLGGAGDTVIWHTNVLHGGSERTDLEKARRSIVCHYFVEGAICYHDLAGTLATFDDQAYD